MAKWLLQPLMAGVIWAPHSWRQGACVCVCVFFPYTPFCVSKKSRALRIFQYLEMASREVFVGSLGVSMQGTKADTRVEAKLVRAGGLWTGCPKHREWLKASEKR